MPRRFVIGCLQRHSIFRPLLRRRWGRIDSDVVVADDERSTRPAFDLPATGVPFWLAAQPTRARLAERAETVVERIAP